MPHLCTRAPQRSARRYVQWIEDQMGVHCKWIGVGPGRDAVVVKPLGR